MHAQDKGKIRNNQARLAHVAILGRRMALVLRYSRSVSGYSMGSNRAQAP
jgi:hypothetical protein